MTRREWPQELVSGLTPLKAPCAAVTSSKMLQEARLAYATVCLTEGHCCTRTVKQRVSASEVRVALPRGLRHRVTAITEPPEMPVSSDMDLALAHSLKLGTRRICAAYALTAERHGAERTGRVFLDLGFEMVLVAESRAHC